MVRTLYVIEFSDGTVKVGRATNYAARRAQHVKDVTQYGRHITREFTREVSWVDAERDEQAVIDYCLVLGGVRMGREWFRGVSFDDVKAFVMSADFATEGPRLASIVKAQGMELGDKGAGPHPMWRFDREQKASRLRRRGYGKWGHSIVDMIDARSVSHAMGSFTLKQAKAVTGGFHAGVSPQEYRAVLREAYGEPVNGRYYGRILREVLKDVESAIAHYGPNVTADQAQRWGWPGYPIETWTAALGYVKASGVLVISPDQFR